MRKTAAVKLLCAALLSPVPASAAEIVKVAENHGDTAFVFIHGLESSARTAFTNDEVEPPLSWPDMLSADAAEILKLPYRSLAFKDADIYLVDYSDVFTDDRVNVSIEQMSQQVAEALTTHGLLSDHKHVWFVAHSLGGILTKRMLVKWSADGRQQLLSHVAGVTLLGVPSNGTPVANLGDSDFGKLVQAWLGFKARHISDLRTTATTNTYLQALENDWSRFFERRPVDRSGFPRISCAYETKSQYRISAGFLFSKDIEIVPEIYTKTMCDGETYPVNKTHMDLPAPTSKDDPVLTWFRGQVRQAFLGLAGAGQVFDRAGEPGALASLVTHLQRGHARLDGDGMPLIDEAVSVTGKGVAALETLKLRGDAFAGASWADVLQAVSAQNKCVTVAIADKARRDVSIGLEGPVACAARPPLQVCDPADC